VRKPGTVGRGTNVEVAVMGEGGKLLEVGNQGEVVVRGETVMHGYFRNPEATREAISDGWYRTGDLGILDRDGYLRVTGRIKELINRGGEKISPSQVDAILLEHPAVAMAASFPVPDPIYGEEIHAAVVTKAQLSAEELQRFCQSHLSAFEIPKVIHFVDQLPRNAMHKLDRHRLTDLFSK
jgi:acyl-CoA synthetase (AMP-forming)/AMP-acid ligase II